MATCGVPAGQSPTGADRAGSSQTGPTSLAGRLFPTARVAPVTPGRDRPPNGTGPGATVGAPGAVPTIGPVQTLVLAHGTAGLAGDGVPGSVFYVAVVVAAVVTTLGLRARGPVPLGGPAVAPLTSDATEVGPWPGDALPAPVRVGGQILGVAALALVLAVGWLGSDILGLNPVSLLMGTVTWWSFAALALLLGDWWRVVDPFDALAGAIDRLRTLVPAVVARLRRRPAPDAGPTRSPAPADEEDDEASDWWVPAALLASFAWLLTCHPDGLRPRALALWLTALTAVMVAGAVLGGRAWVRRSSPLAVLGAAVAAASPVGWEGGRVRLRSPLRGLAARAGGRRSLAVLVVVIGDTVWEAASGTQLWADIAGRRVHARVERVRASSGRGDARAGLGVVCAPMAGKLLRVAVQLGERVSAGQLVAVIEAMKMENALTSPLAGVVSTIAVQAPSTLDKGALILEIEAS